MSIVARTEPVAGTRGDGVYTNSPEVRSRPVGVVDRNRAVQSDGPAKLSDLWAIWGHKASVRLVGE